MVEVIFPILRPLDRGWRYLKMDDDLLAFVSGFESEQAAKKKAKSSKSTKEKSRKTTADEDVVKDNTKVSLTDLTDVLKEDVGFANLKKRVDEISGASTKSNSKSGSSVEVVAAPLPTHEQAKLEREAAFALSAQDANKWIPVIKANRKAAHLEFGPKLTQSARVDLIEDAELTPKTPFEAKLAGLLKANGMDSEEGLIKAEQLEMNKMTVEEVEKRYEELAKKRALLFFAEKKHRQQAKIKSKCFRKVVKKEQERKLQKDIESSGASLTKEELREEFVKAEMDRIRERMTLKTRKANQWAHSLLQKRKLEQGSREAVLQQIRDKDRLREEIYGKAKDLLVPSDEDVDSEMEETHTTFDYLNDDFEGEDGEEKEEEEEEETRKIQVVKKRKVTSKRQKVEEDDFELDSDNDNEAGKEMDEIFDFKNENGAKNSEDDNTGATGRRRFAPKDPLNDIQDEMLPRKTSTKKPLELLTTTNPAKSGNPASKKQSKSDLFKLADDEAPQASIIKKAFEADDVFQQFAEAKAAEVEADAPKMIDVTLPGWGSWGGVGLEVAKGKVFQHEPGVVNPEERRDAKLSHVIIHERHSRRADKLSVSKVPYPFKTREEYEKHMAKPVGREWNSTSNFTKAIQPRVEAKAGAIIEPIKLPKSSNK